jgi:WD40 repeat protein
MASKPPKVFISYNRADGDWAEWIAGAVESAGYEPVIQAWHFRPGENFVLRMQQATTEAAITIAVFKAEFAQPEWAAAFAQDPTGEKRQLIPVRVTPCTLHGLLKPIIYVDLVNLGEQDAGRALLDGLKPSGKPAQPPPFPGKHAESDISTAPFPPCLAKLHGVPDLPPHYLPREEVLTGLKEELLSGDASVAITGQGQPVGVQGMGGIGKTVLAAALAHDSEIRQVFSDGIFWVTVGQKPTLLDLQNQLLRRLTGSKETLITEQEAKDSLREALEGRAALIVVDDAWTIDHADAFSVTALPARLLITTRNKDVLVGLGADEHRVEVLSSSDALKMLINWVGQKSPDKLAPEAAEVAKECGNLPLALAMIGATVRLNSRSTAWKDALTRLRRADLGAIKKAFPGYPYPDLLRAIEVSIEALEETDLERYLDLAVFPEDQPIPEGALSVLWNLDEVDTRECMMHLVARSLATWTTGETALILHDLQRDLIHKRREKELPGLHLRLVEAWDALPKLPDFYAWRWLAYHLRNAGCKDDLRRLLLDFNYLQAKLSATDPNALIADYDYLPEDKDLQLVQSALRLSAHVLTRDPWQLAGQLTGRLFGIDDNDIQTLLKQMAQKARRPSLSPLRGNLTPAGGPLVRILEGHSDRVNGVALTPDGRLAVSASGDDTLRVWDLESGQSLCTLEGHSKKVNGVAITPDGRRAVSAADDCTLRVWDLESGQNLCTLEGHSDLVFGVVITADGRRAVSASFDDTLRVWDLESGQSLCTLEGHSSPVLGVAITPDGRGVVSASGDRTLRVWDLESGQSLCTLEGHSRAVLGVAITADGSRAVSASWDNTLRVWNLSGQSLRTLQGHSNWVLGVAITADGRRAVSASWDNTLRIWDLESGQSLRTLQGHSSRITGVAITADGRGVVSASWDKTLRVWDFGTGQSLRTLEGHNDKVNGIAITPDGRRAVSASGDNTLRVWDLGTGRSLSTLQGHSTSVNGVAITPDGRGAVSASGEVTLKLYERDAVPAPGDNTLRVWDLESGQSLRTLEGHSDKVNAVAITPDGRRAVSASDDCTLRVWDLESGQNLRTLEGHRDLVRGVAITPDGRRAVSASWDNTLRVWDLDSGKKVALLTADAPMACCAVSLDGRTIVAGEETGRVHFLQFVEVDEIKPSIGETKIVLLHRKEEQTRSSGSSYSCGICEVTDGGKFSTE